MKLDALRLGVAVGVVWAGGVVFLAVWAALTGFGRPAVDLIGSLYIGYGLTVGGAIVGALWGFVDGFIGGLLVAWVYNLLRRFR